MVCRVFDWFRLVMPVLQTSFGRLVATPNCWLGPGGCTVRGYLVVLHLLVSWLTLHWMGKNPLKASKLKNKVWVPRLQCYVQICFACKEAGRGEQPFFCKSHSPTGHSYCEHRSCPRYFEHKVDKAVRRGYHDARQAKAGAAIIRRRLQLRSRSPERQARGRSPRGERRGETRRSRSRSRRGRDRRSRSPPWRSSRHPAGRDTRMTALHRGITRDSDQALLGGERPPQDERDLRILRSQEVLASEASGNRPAASSVGQPARPMAAGAAQLIAPVEQCPPGPTPGMSPEEGRQALREQLQWTRATAFAQRQAREAGVPESMIPVHMKAKPVTNLGFTVDAKAPGPG